MDFDFVNYLHILETQKDSNNQTRILEAQGRAEHIANATGHKPMNWYEFKQQNAEPDKKGSLINGILGGMAGAVLAMLAVVALSPELPVAILAVAAAGVIGLFAGSKFPHADETRSHQLDRYETYLNNVELEGQSKAPAYRIDKMPPLVEGNNVERLSNQDMATIAATSAMAK